MSQVKNLRAMFEHKGPSSPPERGREGAPGQSDSPRPLSRVRTNFVTVEKDGRIGLQRDTSTDSIPTLTRTMSAGTEGDLPMPTTTQAGVPEVRGSPEARPIVVAQTPKRKPSVVPEEAHVSPIKMATPLAALSKPALGATPKVLVPGIFAATPVATDKVEESKENKENKPADSAAAPAEKSPVRKLFTKPFSKPIDSDKTTSEAPKKSPDALAGGATRLRTTTPHSGGTNGASKTKSDAPKAAAVPAATSSLPMRSKIPGAASAPKEAAKTAPKAAKSVPKAISTAKTTTKTTAKSAGIKVKTPTSPSKPQTPRLAASKPVADKKTTSAAVADKKSTPATAAPKGAASKKPSNIQTFPPNGAAFVKPKPKSPTRPVQLPPSLTTHTAASATKTQQSLSRQSGNYLAIHGASQATATRPLSRASASTAGGAASSLPKNKTLRRQKSTIGPQRPSIGPPPKQPARDHPVIKKEKAIDEGFLERLMRPTQSFACKTADKVHQSPPRSNRSRSSFGSARSTASSTRTTREKMIAVSKGAPTNETEAVPSPVIVVATAPHEEHKSEPEMVVEDVKEKIEDAAEPVEPETIEPTTESAAEFEEAVESGEPETEAHETDAAKEPEVVQEHEVEEPKISEETASEAPVEAEETAEIPETAKKPAEEVAEETPLEEVTPAMEAEVPEAAAAAEPKDITHIDVAEIAVLNAAVEDEAASAKTPEDTPAL